MKSTIKTDNVAVAKFPVVKVWEALSATESAVIALFVSRNEAIYLGSANGNVPGYAVGSSQDYVSIDDPRWSDFTGQIVLDVVNGH